MTSYDIHFTESSTEASYDPKHHMKRLQSIDPSFYKFLQKHDAELLEFDDYEDGLDEKEGDADFEKVHVPPGELHRDSDESDFEVSYPFDELDESGFVPRESQSNK